MKILAVICRVDCHERARFEQEGFTQHRLYYQR